MATRLLEHEIQSFMRVLERKQFEINHKYGPMTIYRWRKKRLERGETFGLDNIPMD